MGTLTSAEIDKLATRKDVKTIAVRNFLSTMGDDAFANYSNARMDARLYKWNAATLGAIMEGIHLAKEKSGCRCVCRKGGQLLW